MSKKYRPKHYSNRPPGVKVLKGELASFLYINVQTTMELFLFINGLQHPFRPIKFIKRSEMNRCISVHSTDHKRVLLYKLAYILCNLVIATLWA